MKNLAELTVYNTI